jgi:hypothetical protein
MIMNFVKDEDGKQFIKMDMHNDFVDELFLARLNISIRDLEDYMQNPEAAHPEDLKVYTEQLAAHRKLLEWYTPQ